MHKIAPNEFENSFFLSTSEGPISPSIPLRNPFPLYPRHFLFYSIVPPPHILKRIDAPDWTQFYYVLHKLWTMDLKIKYFGHETVMYHVASIKHCLWGGGKNKFPNK